MTPQVSSTASSEALELLNCFSDGGLANVDLQDLISAVDDNPDVVAFLDGAISVVDELPKARQRAFVHELIELFKRHSQP